MSAARIAHFVTSAATRLGVALLSAALATAAATAQKAVPAAHSLNVSILELMRASVEIPADGIWAVAASDKLSDDEWLLADQDSIQLVAAGAMISMPGIGKDDRKWVANADWQSWVHDYQKAAAQIRAAVKARDLQRLAPAGDRLTQICESCHAKYRPSAPSDGVTRYPFYPKRELPQ